MFSDSIYDLDNYSSEPNQFLDAPFVPTDEVVIEAMLNLAAIGPRDVLYDLGSGDGRILIAAASHHDTRGIGVEIDPLRIEEATESAEYYGVDHLVDFIEEDIFTVDVSEATVVTLYLLQSVNVQLRPQLLSQLRPGTRIISHAFNMGDWKADELCEWSGVSIFKWIVPAQVAGVWNWPGPDGKSYRVELQQKYQHVTGRAWVDDVEVDLKNTKLCGHSLELKIQVDKTTSHNSFTLNFINNELQSVMHDT